MWFPPFLPVAHWFNNTDTSWRHDGRRFKTGPLCLGVAARGSGPSAWLCACACAHNEDALHALQTGPEEARALRRSFAAKGKRPTHMRRQRASPAPGIDRLQRLRNAPRSSTELAAPRTMNTDSIPFPRSRSSLLKSKLFARPRKKRNPRTHINAYCLSLSAPCFRCGGRATTRFDYN